LATRSASAALDEGALAVAGGVAAGAFQTAIVSEHLESSSPCVVRAREELSATILGGGGASGLGNAQAPRFGRGFNTVGCGAEIRFTRD